MAERLQAIRGMNDILPAEARHWQYVEQIFRHCLNSYGYQEIRFPLVESTQLFKRTIGEITDIVEKEMYTFSDLNGDSLTLRPEGTAGCVRACLEHGLLYNQQQKLWYMGPMFRHEKPQKGRYRQFHQVGVEALGMSGPGIELELLALCKRLWSMLGLDDCVQLQINTLGTLEERALYREKLVQYFKLHFETLDEDSKRRLDKNPLRILDSKNPQMQALIAAAPQLRDVIGPESSQHFAAVCEGLTALGLAYTVNPFLVRGLDYYGHTVFEWVTDQLGSQATICAGGRYDKLIEHLGGSPSSAVGLAMGVERLLLLMEKLGKLPGLENTLQLFIMTGNAAHLSQSLALAESLRDQGWCVEVATVLGSFKSQFKRADKSQARLALILGEDEIRQQTVSIKDLRVEKEQQTIPQTALYDYLKAYLQ